MFEAVWECGMAKIFKNIYFKHLFCLVFLWPCYTVGVHLKYSIYLQQSLFGGGGETQSRHKWFKWPNGCLCTNYPDSLEMASSSQKVYPKSGQTTKFQNGTEGFPKSANFFCAIQILYAIMSQHGLYIYTIGNRRECTSVLW